MLQAITAAARHQADQASAREEVQATAEAAPAEDSARADLQEAEVRQEAEDKDNSKPLRQ